LALAKIPKQQISVSGLYGKELSLATDVNGEVQFELPKPSSAHFAVRADINYARWYCACLAFVTTAEVIQKGFMAKAPDDDATHNQPAVNLNPGDIVLRARPTPCWVRVLYPLVKD
jgi:hypothetical protein